MVQYIFTSSTKMTFNTYFLYESELTYMSTNVWMHCIILILMLNRNFKKKVQCLRAIHLIYEILEDNKLTEIYKK